MTDPVPVVIPGPLARSVNVGIVNAAALTAVPCVGIDRAGVWFADALPPTEERAVRDWLATRDDVALARRSALRIAWEGGALNRCDMLFAAHMGDPLPEPIYPPSDPEAPPT